MTLTFDLKTWFKVTGHILPKCTHLVKHESDWVMGREDMLRTSADLRQTDGQTYLYRSPAKEGPN